MSAAALILLAPPLATVALAFGLTVRLAFGFSGGVGVAFGWGVEGR